MWSQRYIKSSLAKTRVKRKNQPFCFLLVSFRFFGFFGVFFWGGGGFENDFGFRKTYNNFQLKVIKYYFKLVGFGRACAPVFLASLTRQTGRCGSPPPSQLRCSPKNKKINYFQKQNASLQALTWAARGVYLSTGLRCTLMSYIAPYWGTMHPTLHPIELRCTLLSYAAFNWATPHPIWDTLHPKSYAAPSELRCSLLSYAAPYLSYAAPWEQYCTLLCYAAP
jgi:hypothetical protein